MKLKRGQDIELSITSYAYGGKGIAKIPGEKGDFVIFVLNAISGQNVLARVTSSKNNYAECKLVKVLKPSPDEVSVPYQSISGAPYITLPIEKQQAYKKSTALNLYEHVGNVKNIQDVFDEYIDSPLLFHYRNKMEYAFSSIRQDVENDIETDDDFALGFKYRGTWWKVENLDKESGMFDTEVENKLKDIRAFLKNTGLPAFHPPKKVGFFRYLVARKSYSKNQLLLSLITSSENVEAFDVKAFSDYLKSLFGERLVGFIHTINDDESEREKFQQGPSHKLFGEDKIVENLLGLNFEISMGSFFQTNPKCAEKLYSKAINYLFEQQPNEDGVIMDLFCGTGTIGQLIASKLPKAKVIGVDIVEDAIKNARENAKRNNVNNVEFFASDVGKFLQEYPQYEGKIDAIILDPPRAGIAPKTLNKVIALGAKRMVYVSCNPSTQARDIQTLTSFGYELKKLSLVDQFPHTAHIEAVALFEKI
jgi:23S rRNA (uracil1939-C5)-methyltransferase